MKFESIATALCKVLRSSCHTFHHNYRGAPPNLGPNSASNFIHRCESVEVSCSQIHPRLFYADVLYKNLNDNERLRLDRIRPAKAQKLTVEDARKLLRLVRLEAFKRRLHQIPEDLISYKDLLQVCVESVEQSCEKEAMDFAKLLDESGHILLVGDTVHLRPHEVVRALEDGMALSLVAMPMAKGCREELAVLEKQKAEIDEEAEKRVKGELRWGLGIFAAKTAVLMRWTFWDLSWDVMEPVCFFVTSIYFMAGYMFFLTTSSPPTLVGFFQARFQVRQKQLMKERKFDVERFKQLQMLSMPRFKY